MKKIRFIFCLLTLFIFVACAPKEYKVSYVVKDEIVEEVMVSGLIDIPNDPVLEGYTFVGWYNGETKWDFTNTITEDITLTAKFEKNIVKYKVEFVVDGKVVVTKEIEEYKVVNKIEDPILEGYTFVGWYNKSVKWDFNSVITSNLTLTAKFEKVVVLMEYYQAMEGHFDDTFKETLHSILKTNHKVLSYSECWSALEIVDAADEDNISCLYTGQLIPKTKHDPGSYPSYAVWNREHSWPNSHGFKSKDYDAYTDLHHLFASEKRINETRGSKDWGYVESGSSDSYGNKWNSSYFEIRDEMKGDIARAMFYLVVRYDDPSELDLELVEGTSTTSSNKTGSLGSLSVLLEWHELDPVSEEEKARNEAVYSIQGNRNPFIDYPEWIEYLYPSV